MNKKQISSEWLDNFIRKHNIEVAKDYGHKKVVKCFLPSHNDSRASAAIFDSGVYHCSSCQARFHLSKMDDNIEFDYTQVKTKLKPTLKFDLVANPEHYVRYPGVIKAANVRGGRVVGVQERWEGIGYFCEGEPGFRLHERIITESITDAILLIENGIPAGSICSAANWDLIRDKIYVPQIDKWGMLAAKKISRNNIVLPWKSEYAKDIRELTKQDLQPLIGRLRKTL